MGHTSLHPKFGENAGLVDGGNKAEAAEAPADDAAADDAAAPAKGGRRRRRSRRKGRKSKKSKKSRKGSRKTRKRKGTKSRKGKRPLNAYFKMMLAAKRKGAASFKYKGRTYKGRKHGRLGMIYKKA